MKTRYLKIDSSACIKGVGEAIQLLILTCKMCGKQYNIESHLSVRTPHKAKSETYDCQRIDLQTFFDGDDDKK